MYVSARDIIDVAHSTEHPPPQHDGHVRGPAHQVAACQDAASVNRLVVLLAVFVWVWNTEKETVDAVAKDFAKNFFSFVKLPPVWMLCSV